MFIPNLIYPLSILDHLKIIIDYLMMLDGHQFFLNLFNKVIIIFFYHLYLVLDILLIV